METNQFSLQLRQLGTATGVWRRWLRLYAKRKSRSLSESLRRNRALGWRRLYGLHYRLLIWKARRGFIVTIAALSLVFALSALAIPAVQQELEPHFATEARLEALRAVFLTLGGALVGAVAIVSSLVLFAMQVNVERMPHGLFKEISTDRRLLGAFALTFILALAVSALSLIPAVQQLGTSIFAAGWAIILTMALFLYGYRRALRLINPIAQLQLVVAGAEKDLNAWVRRADRLIATKPGGAQGKAPEIDYRRVAFMQMNSHWTNSAKQAVLYAISFARRYAEQGDYEVAGAALNSLVAVNAAYVKAKGRTFFASNPIQTSPLVTDGFINDTLEHLRQTTRIGSSRSDERQIEQSLRTMTNLAKLYLGIEYAGERSPKTHAHLAAGYLYYEVERLTAQIPPDVLMEGVRLMGECADAFLRIEGPQAVQTLTQKIGRISCAGAVREDYRPVTLTGVEQLARLSFALLSADSHLVKFGVRFAAKDIRSAMELIAKLIMTIPDSPLTGIHSTYLGPYYSAVSEQALSARLTQLANAVASAGEQDINAQRVIGNFIEWTDGAFETERGLLLEALAKRSHFTFDMISWITHLATLHLALSTTKACSEPNCAKLRLHAQRLISTFSFVPSDEDTICFLENFQLTENLFDAAADARHRECSEMATTTANLLLSWTFKAGRYHTGWATLEHGICGVATLALADGEPAVARLKAGIAARLAAGELPDQQMRAHSAREIRGLAQTLYREGRWNSSIESAMAQQDSSQLQGLLEELADLISPETAGQAALHDIV